MICFAKRKKRSICKLAVIASLAGLEWQLTKIGVGLRGVALRVLRVGLVIGVALGGGGIF
jgi:hypothetical protein